TALMRVAEVAAAVARDRRQPLASRCVAHVVKEGKGPIERGRSQVILVPADRIAGGITHPAIDAFDAGIGCRTRATRGANPLDRIVSRLARGEYALSPVPFRKEGLHVADQILDDAQVGERTNLHAAVLCHLLYVCTAGPARPPVDRHGAAAAHADAAGEAVGQRRVGVALHPGDDVEDGLAPPSGHKVGPVAAIGPAAPQRNLDVVLHAAYLTVTCTRCTTLLP